MTNENQLWSCLDEVEDEFAIFQQNKEFDVAAESREDHSGFLASIRGDQEFAHVIAVLAFAISSDPQVWIGFRVDRDKLNDTQSYQFSDGYQGKSYYPIQNLFPWRSDQPYIYLGRHDE